MKMISQVGIIVGKYVEDGGFVLESITSLINGGVYLAWIVVGMRVNT